MVDNLHSNDPFTVRDTSYKQLGPLQLTEILGTIMRFMTRSSVLRARFVNKQWYQVAQYTLEQHHIMTVDSLGMIHEEQDQLRVLDRVAKRSYCHIIFDGRSISQWPFRKSLRNKELYGDWGAILSYGHQRQHDSDSATTDRSQLHRDTHDYRRESDYLRQLIIQSVEITDDTLRQVLLSHRVSLQRLEIQAMELDNIDLGLIFSALPNLRDLRLAHRYWDSERPRMIRLSLFNRMEHNEADETTALLDHTLQITSFPNMKSLDLRNCEGLGSFLVRLLPGLPNLTTLKLMDCKKFDPVRLWSDIVPHANPLLRHIGFSDRGISSSPEFLNLMLRRYRKAESLELIFNGWTQFTFHVMERFCSALAMLDLSSVDFDGPMSKALSKMLSASTGLRRLIAPRATFSVQDMREEGSQWQCTMLKTLVTQFDLSEENMLTTDADTDVGTDSGCSCSPSGLGHWCNASGVVFRFLKKSCPRLEQLRAHVMPHVCLGTSGLKQLAGLEHLGDLSLVMNVIDGIEPRDIQWLEHENIDLTVTDHEYYWPRLETITLQPESMPREYMAVKDLMSRIQAMSLRFRFIIDLKIPCEFKALAIHK